MIGVVIDPSESWIVEEFFQLFKTPWEAAVPGRRYSVVLKSTKTPDLFDAPVTFVYGSPTSDEAGAAVVKSIEGPVQAEFDGEPLPVYGTAAVFLREQKERFLTIDGQSLAWRCESPGRSVWRIGYDLFDESRLLLSEGQSTAGALVPTLELHIAILRRLLVESGMSFVEIPPRPAGFDFSCCLTHDVDFFGIRRHFVDATLAGFTLRASVVTLIDWFRGRRTMADVLRNWLALGSLPLVFLRLRRDPWNPVEDYLGADRGQPSTFFVVAFKGQAGAGRATPSNRAVAYEAAEVAEELRKASAHDCEVAVHGVDAWHDADRGRAELARVTGLTRQARVGVRMHWLYFAQGSPDCIERAGFDYDSTWGYNDAAGYRAGTSQAFQLPGTRLMELPMALMDTALFYPDRMNLTHSEAETVYARIISNARRFGGTVVINWHDRSLAPERLWNRAYDKLLDVVSGGNRVWFATGSQAVDWYRWRRSIRFEYQHEWGQVSVTAPHRPAHLPGADMYLRRPGRLSNATEAVVPVSDGQSVTLQL